MSRQPGPAKADSVFSASIFQLQFLAISTDGQGFVCILGRWPLAILADGRGFVVILGIWSRISRQMAKNLSLFLADGSGFVSKWPRISWDFG